jgi:methionyl-tRNA formyltransferase
VRVLFCGTPDFAAVVLDAILVGPHPVIGVLTQPSRPQGRGLALADPPAAAKAKSAGIEVIQTAKVHAAETLDRMRAWQPDVIVTAAFGRILRPVLLALPRRGCWNVHASILPRHRGASPVTAALLAGDAWTGVTIFQMEEGLDTGPILLQELTPIGPAETAGELTSRLAEMGGRLVRRALDLAEAGTLTAVPQPSFGATYAPMLHKEDGRVLWSRPADQVERMVRAVTPWPGAFSFVEGRRLGIHRLTVVDRVARPEAPGTAMAVEGGLGVVCLPGLVVLQEIQSEGKKRQEAKEWLRGNRLPDGARLDPPA